MDQADIANWKPLFKIASFCALTVVAFTLIQIIVYVVSLPPDTVAGFFDLMNKNPLQGLLSLDLIMLADYALQIPLVLVLYITLRRSNQSYVLIAAAIGLIAIAIYFASGISFDMLTLSSQYASASTEAQKTALLAAGEALLANYQGTAFNVSYVMLASSFLIFSAVMLKSHVFSKKTAYVGIIMAFFMLLPPTAGMIGIVFSFVSLVPMIAWFILISKTLLKLSR